MAQVTAAELKTDTDDILQRVQDDCDQVEIVRDGRVIARIVPIRSSISSVPALQPRSAECDEAQEATVSPIERSQTIDVLDSLDQLAKEIGTRWPRGVSAVDAVRDVRREL